VTHKAKTQGRIVIEALKRAPLSYRQMLNLGQGNSPWKRVMECLREDEDLQRLTNAGTGLVHWRVRTIRPTKWTA
jgi:hypothetical protein